MDENLSFELYETETLREVSTNSLPLQQEARESGDEDKAPLYPSAKITIGSTIVFWFCSLLSTTWLLTQ